MPTSNVQFRGFLSRNFIVKRAATFQSIPLTRSSRPRLEFSSSPFFFKQYPRINDYSIQSVNYPINYVLF